jgi:hypothetical protein
MAIPVYKSLMLPLLVLPSDESNSGLDVTTAASYVIKWVDSDYFGEE